MTEPNAAWHELDMDGVDLEALRAHLQEQFLGRRPTGYVPGKTVIREAITDLLSCSDLEAENLVDTLEAHGLIRYEGVRLDGIDDLEHTWSFRNEI